MPLIHKCCLLLLVFVGTSMHAWAKVAAFPLRTAGNVVGILVHHTDPDAPPAQMNPNPCFNHSGDGFTVGPNVYAYVMQNPWGAFDPKGLATILTHDESLRKKGNSSSNNEPEAKASTITGSNQKTASSELKPTANAKDMEEHPFLEAAVNDSIKKSARLNHVEMTEATTMHDDPRYQRAVANEIDRQFPREPTVEEKIVDVAKEAAITAILSRIPLGRMGRAGAAAKTGGAAVPEGMTTLYHGGVLRGGTVQAGRFSTTTELEHAMRYAAQKEGGQVYQFQVPTRKLNQWMNDFKVQEFRDTLQGTSGSALELRFSPSVAPELNNFFVPPP